MVHEPISASDYTASTDDSGSRTVAAAVEILEQGEALLQRLSQGDYSRAHACAFSASIGEHYRHCLDHFSCFLRGLDSAVINYDERERDPALETDIPSAIRVTRRLKEELRVVDVMILKKPCRTVCKVSYLEAASPECGSSFSRELAYVIAHAIHHYALVAIICSVAGIELPRGFGVAPSTLAHQASR